MLKAAREVGGDFYNFFELNDGRIVLSIGDVSGKGVPAALFMTLAKTLMESHSRENPSPGKLVTKLNNDLCKGNEENMFVTLFVALLDPREGTIRYCNGGHNPPFILSDNGELIRLGIRHGPVVGAIEGVEYGEAEISVSQGDTLFIYTDGVTEAMDSDQQLYGEERLKETLTSLRFESATYVVKTVAEQIERFEDESGMQSDDITILAARLLHEDEDERVLVLELTLDNRIEEIKRVNDQFKEMAIERGIDRSIIQKFNIVFDELLSNIIYYGSKERESSIIRIRIEFVADSIKVAIASYGAPFNPLESQAPDTSQSLEDRNVGGLGIHIVRNLVDEMAYYRRAEQNVINLLKYLNTDEKG